MEELLLQSHAWLLNAVSSGFSYVFPLYLKEKSTSRLPIPLLSEMSKRELETYFATLFKRCCKFWVYTFEEFAESCNFQTIDYLDLGFLHNIEGFPSFHPSPYPPFFLLVSLMYFFFTGLFLVYQDSSFRVVH